MASTVTMRRLTAGVFVLVAVALWRPATLTFAPLPNKAGTLKFAVIGDNGTGDTAQYEVAAEMVRRRAAFPFDLVLMMGDNFYGSQRGPDLVSKFERPYRALLGAGVRFHAALGNHDEPDTISYPPINMGGQRYYTFARDDARFFVLDTNSLDQRQLAWFEAALQGSKEAWKISYFHHPLYSNAGRHGSNADIRLRLEPLLLKYGVAVVFSGHDHIYERLVPQKGITYFVVGASGKLRNGDLQRSATTAAGFDRDQSFMLVEVDGPTMFFETVSRTGTTVDSGTIRRMMPNLGT